MIPELVVFVIEDNRVFSMLVKSELEVIFEGKNVEIKLFGTGEECEKVLDQKEPDLVIVDHHLNSVDEHAMNGLQVIEMIRARYKDPEYIIMTMDEHTELFLKSKELDIYDYLIKSSHAAFRLNLSVNNWLKSKDL